MSLLMTSSAVLCSSACTLHGDDVTLAELLQSVALFLLPAHLAWDGNGMPFVIADDRLLCSSLVVIKIVFVTINAHPPSYLLRYSYLSHGTLQVSSGHSWTPSDAITAELLIMARA